MSPEDNNQEKSLVPPKILLNQHSSMARNKQVKQIFKYVYMRKVPIVAVESYATITNLKVSRKKKWDQFKMV